MRASQDFRRRVSLSFSVTSNSFTFLIALRTLFKRVICSSASLRSVMSSAAQIMYSTSPSSLSFGVFVTDSKRSSPLPFLTHSSTRICLFFSNTSLLPSVQTSNSSLVKMSRRLLPSRSSLSTPKNSAWALFTAPQVSVSARYQI